MKFRIYLKMGCFPVRMSNQIKIQVVSISKFVFSGMLLIGHQLLLTFVFVTTNHIWQCMLSVSLGAYFWSLICKSALIVAIPATENATRSIQFNSFHTIESHKLREYGCLLHYYYYIIIPIINSMGTLSRSVALFQFSSHSFCGILIRLKCSFSSSSFGFKHFVPFVLLHSIELNFSSASHLSTWIC